jgi:hypothetical protein
MRFRLPFPTHTILQKISQNLKEKCCTSFLFLRQCCLFLPNQEKIETTKLEFSFSPSMNFIFLSTLAPNGTSISFPLYLFGPPFSPSFHNLSPTFQLEKMLTPDPVFTSVISTRRHSCQGLQHTVPATLLPVFQCHACQFMFF